MMNSRINRVRIEASYKYGRPRAARDFGDLLASPQRGKGECMHEREGLITERPRAVKKIAPLQRARISLRVVVIPQRN